MIEITRGVSKIEEIIKNNIRDREWNIFKGLTFRGDRRIISLILRGEPL
jgi:hypothetical protein